MNTEYESPWGYLLVSIISAVAGALFWYFDAIAIVLILCLIAFVNSALLFISIVATNNSIAKVKKSEPTELKIKVVPVPMPKGHIEAGEELMLKIKREQKGNE